MAWEGTPAGRGRRVLLAFGAGRRYEWSVRRVIHPNPLLRPPGWARRVMGLSTLLLVAFVTMAQGFGYTWCAPMQRAMARPCCPQGHADADDPGGHGPAVDAPCCEARRVGALPAVELPEVLHGAVAPAPLVALICFALWMAAMRAPSALVRVRGRAHRVRAGPPPRLFLLHGHWLN